ncbi:DsbE family thiol:disulfide interchange protein [Roseovarius spongiae]|uniref:DsbE family thiol:disulfide interchange protein n=1 Tax=Roseovarius spongiae TaxID=2320272 RepID=A0A3A8AUY8_9RHOB|nr:DsbE family thiol:disulfide interchange protein [Roseovarius spongiae]RKF12855.1 DsbE family thiol:disulfide interchange protein [Roseovarius spongiae]
MTDTVHPAKRPIRWKYFLGALMLALPVLLAVGLTRDPGKLPSALEGRSMPSFEIPYLAQEGTLDSAAFKGKPLVLNFWASWCVSCRHEHDELIRLGLRSAAQGDFRVAGVNYRDDPDRAQGYLAREGAFPYPSGYDGKGRLGIDFGVYGMPETFFVDAGGTVQMRHAGPLTDAVLARALPKIGVTP